MPEPDQAETTAPQALDRPAIALLGGLPPPYGGYATYVKLLYESSLAERFGYAHIDTSHPPLGSGLKRLANLARLIVRDFVRFRRAMRVESVRAIHMVVEYNVRRFRQHSLFFDWAGRNRWARIFDIRAGGFIRFAETAPPSLQTRLGEILRSAEAVTVEGLPYVDYVRERWDVRAIYMPNFIRWDETGQQLQGDPGTDEGPLRVVFTGRLAMDKGVVELAEAVALVPTDVPIHVEFVGPAEGTAGDAVREVIRRKGLEDRITLSGGMPKEQLLKRLAGGQVYAMPTYHATEGHSNALTEAMSLGLPVISCDQGFTSDVLGDEAGILVAQRDSRALAEAIIRLARDADLRRRMGEAARRRARDLYSDLAVIGKWADIYEDLVEGRAPQARDAAS